MSLQQQRRLLPLRQQLQQLLRVCNVSLNNDEAPEQASTTQRRSTNDSGFTTVAPTTVETTTEAPEAPQYRYQKLGVWAAVVALLAGSMLVIVNRKILSIVNNAC